MPPDEKSNLTTVKIFGSPLAANKDDSSSMKKLLLCALLLLTTTDAATAAPVKNRARRTLSGMIYFTNDTPPDKHTFPVELFTRDRRRRVVSGRPNKHGGFELKGIRPGQYILKLSWPRTGCELWYKADLRRESKTNITIVMDAACSGGSRVRELPVR